MFIWSFEQARCGHSRARFLQTTLVRTQIVHHYCHVALLWRYLRLPPLCLGFPTHRSRHNHETILAPTVTWGFESRHPNTTSQHPQSQAQFKFCTCNVSFAPRLRPALSIVASTSDTQAEFEGHTSTKVLCVSRHVTLDHCEKGNTKRKLNKHDTQG